MANNSWWEIQVLCEPVLEDLVFWRLEWFGCQGTASERRGRVCLVKAYLPQDKVHTLDLAALSLLVKQDALCAQFLAPEMKWGLIDEEDWSSSWKQHWCPQAVGDRFLVHPAWMPLPAERDRLILKLDPGTAFGTGGHATTQHAQQPTLGNCVTFAYGRLEYPGGRTRDHLV
ncbi:MAG: hypothetical protein F6K30_01470, partial [Cyanothece sp. SIO2G6]|nr:hypothetical protein [Cyanothece sp. SIO2G6]